ncbi:cyclic AMP-responsive element-binding protein 3-like protein 3 [Asterias amurensis]|uniref:cyclic AMP-responsive element-binding protein 3-like protein 3 n=1 Tax=Asterias amurensis TaxID=7602 RepID=UPI003AB6B778
MSLKVETLRERNESGSSDLDLLFNQTDGILMDDCDTFISFNNEADAMSSTADDLFSNLLNGGFDLSTISQTAYDTQVASPGNSDSGISDNVSSPSQYQSDSQSGGSPQHIDDLDEMSMKVPDMSSYLIGPDTMLMEDATIENSDLESIGFEWDLNKLSPSESKKSSLPMTVQDVKVLSATMSTRTISTSDSSYPKLRLTDEEKRLLAEMNINLPADMPLTKEEERSLKTVRRKIRNKISAMDSRKRKKVYVDGLEHRVHLCTKQNLDMQKKMAKLENENKTLMEQLKKLQSLVTKSTSKAAQSSTCVMVLLLSFALLIAPSFNPFTSSKDSQAPSQTPQGVVSRTLLKADDTHYTEHGPINLGRFGKIPNHQAGEALPNEEVVAKDMDNVNADSGATMTEPAPANEVAPSTDQSLNSDNEVVVKEVKVSNVNQSRVDTGDIVQQHQAVKNTPKHGGEI